MRLVPANLRQIYEDAMPGRFVFIDDPSNADYLHLAEDLAELLLRYPGIGAHFAYHF